MVLTINCALNAQGQHTSGPPRAVMVAPARFDPYATHQPAAVGGGTASLIGWRQSEVSPLVPCAIPACGLPGVYVYAELFNWEATTNHPAVIARDDAGELAPLTAELDANFGFRAGAGWRLASGWDVGVSYTDFDTSGSLAIGDAPPNAEGGSEFDDLVFVTTALFDVDGVVESVNQEVQVLDLEAGKKQCVSETLIIRRNFGVRYARLGHSRTTDLFDFVSANGPGPEDDEINREAFRTRTSLDGIGPRVGGLISWNFRGSGLQIFSRQAIALLWSDVNFDASFQRVDDINTAPTPSIDTALRESVDGLVPVLEISIGLRYERRGFFISGGYELQDWFNAIYSPTRIPGPTTVDPIVLVEQDLRLGGFFFRGGYNF